MMDDKKLDRLLDDAARTYRVPPEAPFEAIWARVEMEAFAPVPIRRTPAWRPMVAAIAAALVLGVALGRYTASGPAPARSGTLAAGAAQPSNAVNASNDP